MAASRCRRLAVGIVKRRDEGRDGGGQVDRVRLPAMH
jgi:hypothetical protein